MTRDDPFFPLVGATNDPPPLRAGGPPIWLGGQKRRGIALAAEIADGWLLPAVLPDKSETDMTYFEDRRDALLAALDAAGRDPAGFALVAQVPAGATAETRRAALAGALRARRSGATHVILGIPPALGPAGRGRRRRATSRSRCGTRGRSPDGLEGCGMTAAIRLARPTDEDYAAIAALTNAVTPEDPTSVESMRWADATYPGGERWIAETDGRAVGVGTVGRIYMYAPDFDAFWATIHVHPDARRAGVGGALLDARSRGRPRGRQDPPAHPDERRAPGWRSPS